MSYKTQCSVCSSQFAQKKNFYAHLRKYHKIEPILAKKSVPKFQCTVCLKFFSYKSSLAKHFRSHETETDDDNTKVPFLQRSRLLCPHEYCEQRFPSYAVLRSHLFNEHCIEVELEHLKFDSLQSFEIWKSTIEQETSSLYTRDSSPKKLSTSAVFKLYFNCHRSHFFRPQGTGVRSLKIRGSNKIGKACPSRIEVSIIHNVEHVSASPLIRVKFWKTHYGHDLQVNRISLDGRTREKIAGKLQEGKSFDQILSSVKSPKTSHNNINPRLSLLTRKDLHNIVRDYNIDYNSSKDRNKVLSENSLNEEIGVQEDVELDSVFNIEIQENTELTKNSLEEEMNLLEEDHASYTEKYLVSGIEEEKCDEYITVENINVHIENELESSQNITILHSPFNVNIVKKLELILDLVNNKTLSDHNAKIIENNLDNVVNVLKEEDTIVLISHE